MTLTRNDNRSSRPAMGDHVDDLLRSLRAAQEHVSQQTSRTELDRLVRTLASARDSDDDARAEAERKARSFCLKHDMLDVLANAGVPHVYDYSRSFAENNGHGPSDSREAEKIAGPASGWRLVGREIGYPIGVPASGLTASADWINYFAERGFNVLTYKTVRSRKWSAHPPPNWVFLDGLTEPLPLDTNLESLAARASDDAYPRNTRAYSMANSFGVPSPEPLVWQRDVAKAEALLGSGNLLIVSVIGTSELYSGSDLIADFVRVAQLAEEAGAKAIELNLSCPNTVDPSGAGMMKPVSDSYEATREIVDAVRSSLRRADTRLVAKLGYLRRERLEEIVSGIAESVDAISGINTLPIRVEDEHGEPEFKGTADDPERAREIAGVSGIALREYALDFVRSLVTIKRASGGTFDVIAMGGIMDAHDARSLFATGADAVQTATAVANDPDLAVELLKGVSADASHDVLDAVHAALADERWDFRTAGGIARELDLDVNQVETMLEKHPEIARKSVMRDREGRTIYTLRDRPPTVRERIARTRWLLTH
jgi:dihydroorotate dehydrogenase